MYSGVELARALFFFFFLLCERALRGVPNAKRTYDSFCVMRLFSLSSIARVKRGAEGALERFEELKNNSKRVFFV
jgi:hypothetical protein